MNKKLLTIGLLAIATVFTSCKKDEDAPDDSDNNVWSKGEKTFTKASNADWTLSANQDKITDDVIFTRQDTKPIYNNQHYQDSLGRDATTDELGDDFWFNNAAAVGGTHGVLWGIVDTTGQGWDEDFSLIAKPGKPANFVSFHALASMITSLNDGENVIGFNGEGEVAHEGGGTNDGTVMKELEGVELAAYIVDEDIYFYIEFIEWGDNASGGALSYKRTTK